MGYEAEIIADSIGPNGIRLTTFRVRYPRFIHAEFLRHRSLSRSVKSSRAKPIKHVIKEVLDDPVFPLAWGKNKKGMQSSKKEIKYPWLANQVWKFGLYTSLLTQYLLNKLGVHKQYSNRVSEPYLFVDELITATNFDNLFNLRIHNDSQPEAQKIVSMMAKLYYNSTPKKLEVGEWHLPYINDDEREIYNIKDLLKFSAARCARISYKTFDGNSANPQDDLNLWEKLNLEGNKDHQKYPPHSSPAEAQGMATDEYKWSGNFYGWVQHRKLLKNECCDKFDKNRLEKYKEKDYII